MSSNEMTSSRLSDLCTQVTDGTHDSPILQPTGVPFIKGTHISKGYIDFDNCDFINYTDHLKVIARSKPQRGDILFSNIGSLGDAAFVSTDKEFSIKNVALFKPDSRKINNRYLFYYIISSGFQTEIEKKRSGSAQPFLGLATLRNHTVRHHIDLSTQNRVAAILSAYDGLIENNIRRIRLLEEMAQTIYREWFVNFRFPGHQKVRMVNSPLGKIPEGWEAATLETLCKEVRRSVQPNKIEPTTPYFGLEHLPRKSIALAEWGYAGDVQSTKLAFLKGEILFGKIRPYFHKVGVAPVDGVCSSDAIVIVPKNAEVFGIVLSCVSSEAFVAHATKTSQGTKMPRANWDVLLKYCVAMPPRKLLEHFNSLITDIILQIQNMVFRSRNLRQNRDLLLPKLISGEVDVSELDIEMRGNTP